MTPEDFVEDILEHFENRGLLDEGVEPPNPDQIVEVMQFMTNLIDLGYELDTMVPDALDYLQRRNKEQALLSNQISNYADMGDESSIIQKF